MAVVNFRVRAFLLSLHCCFLMNVPFSFKVSKASKPPSNTISDPFGCKKLRDIAQ